LISDVRSRPKDFIRELQIAKVVRFVKIDPRGARFVKRKDIPIVFIPIVIIWFWATKSINSTI
jgi:hypothetical protein